MSSAATFPLFNLPHVSIRNVIDFWNPFELCDFSMISKKCKKMAETKAKSINKKPSIVDVELTNELKFFLVFLKNKEEKLEIEARTSKVFPKHTQKSSYEKVVNLNSDKNISIELKWLENAVKLFNSTFNHIQLFCEGISEDDFISVINWINLCNSSKISFMFMYAVGINGQREWFISAFIKYIQTNIEKLEIRGSFDSRKRSEPIKFHKNLMVNSFDTYDSIRFDLNICLSLNCLEARGGTTLTNTDVNVFFKSWQNMESNLRLRLCNYSTVHKLNWNTVLEGLSPVLRDPRTTKRFYQSPLNNWYKVWIHGGVDIQRNDGKIMTIADFGHYATEEDELVPQKAIDKYENIESTKNWNWIQEQRVNNGDKWNKFLLFVW